MPSVPLAAKPALFVYSVKFLRPRCLLLFCLILLLGYAWLIEPQRLTVQRLTIKDQALAQAWPGLTILHLSDLHIVEEGRREARLLAMIKGIKPHLILLSGDFKQWGHAPGPAQHFLSQLDAPLGVFAVLGDADLGVSRADCAYCHPGERYAERLDRPVILQNELRQLAWRGRTVTVAGIGPDEAGQAWLETLRAKPALAQEPLLILNHRSAGWLTHPLAAPSLWLAGDSHGGQIRLPDWFWRLVPYKPDPAHMGGLYSNGHGGWLLVNRGIGQSPFFPFRLGVPPELLVVTFAEP